MSRVRRMSVTESWYALWRTKFQTGIDHAAPGMGRPVVRPSDERATHLGGMIPYARILR